MTDKTALPQMPAPLLEDVDYEVWGQNAKTDCFTPEAMRSYGRTCYAAGVAAERAKMGEPIGYVDPSVARDMLLGRIETATLVRKEDAVLEDSSNYYAFTDRPCYLISASPSAAARAEPTEPEIRRMLCQAYAGALAYMDDGEAQDNRVFPFIDFIRDSAEDIRRKMLIRAQAVFASPQPTAEPARDPHRGGNSYEASMLRILLAHIHQDGGHYIEEHGLDKALDAASDLISEWRAEPRAVTGGEALTDEQERAAFEAAMRQCDVMPATLQRLEEGYTYVNLAWRAWKARAALAASTPQAAQQEGEPK